MEVPSLEPIFYESKRAREDPEMAERKKLKRELAMERRTTKRHLTRDAQATQAIAAQQKRKFDETQEEAAKRVRRILDQSESEIRKLSTTNRKRILKPKKRAPRMAGNKTEDN
jgi:DNA anti-recombination protein RmuC